MEGYALSRSEMSQLLMADMQLQGYDLCLGNHCSVQGSPWVHTAEAFKTFFFFNIKTGNKYYCLTATITILGQSKSLSS